MRVLQLLVSTRLGGGSRHVFDLTRGLAATGVTPIVAAPRDGPFFERFEKAGIETHAAALNRLSPQTLARVVGLARRQRVDVVHSHGKGAGLYGRLAARMLGLPAVHTFHGLHHERYRPLARRAYVRLEAALARFTRTVINVTESQQATGVALGLFRLSRSVVIPNGVDAAEIDALVAGRAVTRGAQGLALDDLVVGSVARFDAVKALDELLEAVHRARATTPRLRAVLVGTGPEEGRLYARTHTLGLDDTVIFTGPVEDAVRLFAAWDLYVTASRVEGLPLTVLEAMACRRAVVATDIPGHGVAITEGVTGLLTPPGDVDALSRAMESLLASPARRRDMGEAGRRRVEADFALGPMVARVVDVYEKAAKP